jgi:hypothetical protein
MQVASLVIGILTAVGSFIGFIPCFGWLNFINVPLAIVGLILGIISVSSAQPGQKTPSVVGISCCSFAILFGLIRLIISMAVGGFGIA